MTCPVCQANTEQLLVDIKTAKDTDNMSYHPVYIDVKIYFCRMCKNIYGDDL